MTRPPGPTSLESSLMNSLRQAQELMASKVPYSVNDIANFGTLWEQNTELLGQAYPQYILLAQLTKALISYVRYGSVTNPRHDIQEYFESQVRSAEKAIYRFNDLAEDEDEMIRVPDYFLDKPELECGRVELEKSAMKIAKSYPLFSKIMAASLQTGLLGPIEKLAQALKTLEMACYLFPPPRVPLYVLTLVGDSPNLTPVEVNDLFLKSDRILQLNFAAWAMKQNQEILEKWAEQVRGLIGYPLGFNYVGSVTPLARLVYWVRSLEMAKWEGTLMAQALKISKF